MYVEKWHIKYRNNEFMEYFPVQSLTEGSQYYMYPRINTTFSEMYSNILASRNEQDKWKQCSKLSMWRTKAVAISWNAALKSPSIDFNQLLNENIGHSLYTPHTISWWDLKWPLVLHRMEIVTRMTLEPLLVSYQNRQEHNTQLDQCYPMLLGFQHNHYVYFQSFQYYCLKVYQSVKRSRDDIIKKKLIWWKKTCWWITENVFISWPKMELKC